jgi:putative endonuclease
MKHYYVYIMSSKSGTLYTGIASNLERRVYQHKNKVFEGFTKKYDVTRLVYCEVYHYVRDAIARENRLRNGDGERNWT